MKEKRDTILIVDDIELNRTILGGLFQEEYHLLEAENGEQALLLLEQYHSRITILLLDLVMPVKDGYAVLEAMGTSGLLDEVPVVVITADNSPESELRAFDLGASDIVTKPFEPYVVKRRVHNIVELALHRHHLEELVEDQAVRLRESNEIIVDALSSVIEYRSLESGQHIRRIRLLSRRLLEEVARNCPEYRLDEKQIRVIASASALHDIGKIAIPDRILNKPARLTAEEFAVMRTHTEKGCEILEGLSRMGDKEYLRYARNICLYHHERWDGRGYPAGLVGDAIPICAQVVGVVDAYDALTSDRVYKRAIAHDQAVSMILNGECGAFAPTLLACLKSVQLELAELVRRYADGCRLAGEQEQPPDPALLRGSELGALELEQMKYNAMLRYENATVAEIDLAAGSIHMVYAGSAAVRTLFQGDGLEVAARRYIRELAHPDDAGEVRRLWEEELPAFFSEGLLKKSWRHRLLDPSGSRWRRCRLTALRIDTEHPRQRKALLLWTAAESAASRGADDGDALRGVLSGVFRCRHDQGLTLLGMDGGLLGYSPEELETRFGGSFLELVHPDDRQRVRRELRQQLSRGSGFALEYRVNNAAGRTVWMLCRGQDLSDREGRDELYCLLIDIDPFKHAQEELRLSLERYRIILDQTNDIIYEWDIQADHVTYSANWKEKFGYEPVSETASVRIPKVSHLHPEDMAAFGAFIERMRSGARYGELEFRVADRLGAYRWCRIRATAQFDDSGAPCKVVGTVVDINDEKLENQELRAQAERDTLTKLLNKTSSRERIEAWLSRRQPKEGGTLFIIDLDDFKQVNDNFGHLFGDAVLTKTADQLSALVRGGDVVARIGGDEFLAFLPGAAGEELAGAMAERIVESFRQAFRELPCGVRCSVGVALCPRDGTDFQTLFQRADVALYRAKSQGKDGYALYDAGMLLDLPANRKPTVGARIDSDEQGALELNDLIPLTFHILNGAEDLDEAISQVLELVGRRAKVSRTYIFENSEDDSSASNTYEWCSEGVSPQKDNLQEIPYTMKRHYSGNFNERGVFYCPDVSQLPARLQELLAPQGVQAMLQCAIRDGRRFRGWVGFDECGGKHLWTQDQIDVLSYLAELLSLFLLRRRAQERVARLAENLKGLLDNQSAWIYVLDPDTYRLHYINRRTRELVPEAEVGMRCYEVFMGREEPCEPCPMRCARESGRCTMEIRNEKLHVWTAADAARIRWEDREASLLVCSDITRFKAEDARAWGACEPG